MTCSIEGCVSRVVARGWCNKHYHRWSRHGDPLVVMPPSPPPRPAAVPVRDRFWAKVQKGGPDDCWLWTGSDNGNGYGQFHLHRLPGDRVTLVRAHRFAYEDLVGPIPEGLTIDHLCRNRRCVNPRHLEPVTLAENLRRNRLEVCPNGHPKTPESTYLYRNRDGRDMRFCKLCRSQAQEKRTD